MTLLVAVVVLGACGSGDGDETLGGMTRTPALSVGEVELLDVSSQPDGEPVPMRAPDGELLLVYFGYTSCPDICPTTMSDISVAVNDLPADKAQRVTVGMVTVDPDRDTPDVLAAYLGHFFDAPLPLRAVDEVDLTTAADAFGVRYEVADHEPDDTAYEVSHSAVTYVVDDTGKVAVEWPFGFDSEQMTSDLAKLLEG